MLIVDTHVHLYPEYDLAVALDAALGHADCVLPDARMLLCLTDTAGVRSEQRLPERIRQAGAWRFERHAADGRTIVAHRADGRSLLLVPGRQLISRENLEVLALDGLLEVPDRTVGADDLVSMVRAEGGVPVLPWAFGKWTGARGRVVRGLLDTRDDFLIADNGNRPACSLEPTLLRLARTMGRVVIAGSDPLPLPGQEGRVGSCGIMADVPEGLLPGEALRKAVSSETVRQSYGSGASLWTFASTMIALRRRSARLKAR